MTQRTLAERRRELISALNWETHSFELAKQELVKGGTQEMMHWLDRFQSEFVELRIPPPKNFFLNDDENPDQRERYLRFLERTKELASQVDVLAHLPNSEIQRASGTHPGNTPWFLD